MRNYRKIKWNDEIIKQEILKVKDALCLNRMPTRSEIESVMKNSCLTDKITKTRGYYGWAKELKLDIKLSETTLGKKYEQFIKQLLETKQYKVEQMSQNYHFDLLINNNVKIDVKVAKPFVDRYNCIYHTFRLCKKYASCDIYITICLNNKEEIEKLLIIPSSKCQIKQLSIGKNSVYDIYIDRFDYIDKYIKFYENLN